MQFSHHFGKEFRSPPFNYSVTISFFLYSFSLLVHRQVYSCRRTYFTLYAALMIDHVYLLIMVTFAGCWHYISLVGIYVFLLSTKQITRFTRGLMLVKPKYRILVPGEGHFPRRFKCRSSFFFSLTKRFLDPNLLVSVISITVL